MDIPGKKQTNTQTNKQKQQKTPSKQNKDKIFALQKRNSSLKNKDILAWSSCIRIRDVSF